MLLFLLNQKPWFVATKADSYAILKISLTLLLSTSSFPNSDAWISCTSSSEACSLFAAVILCSFQSTDLLYSIIFFSKAFKPWARRSATGFSEKYIFLGLRLSRVTDFDWWSWSIRLKILKKHLLMDDNLFDKLVRLLRSGHLLTSMITPHIYLIHSQSNFTKSIYW